MNELLNLASLSSQMPEKVIPKLVGWRVREGGREGGREGERERGREVGKEGGKKERNYVRKEV